MFHRAGGGLLRLSATATRNQKVENQLVANSESRALGWRKRHIDIQEKNHRVMKPCHQSAHHSAISESAQLGAIRESAQLGAMSAPRVWYGYHFLSYVHLRR